MIARSTAGFLVGLALALGACGADSGGHGESGDGTTSAEETGTSGGAPGGTAKIEPEREGGGKADSLKVDPDRNQEPVPEGSVPPEDRTGDPPRYTRENPIPKEQLKAVERPIFEQSQYLCKRLGVEGMRREYRIGSNDAREIAREVARRTYLPETRDAVYSGCLAGLRSGD